MDANVAETIPVKTPDADVGPLQHPRWSSL